MPTDFPNGVPVPGGASYQSPLLDFSALGDMANSYYKGQNDQLQLKAKTAFRNGIPKTAEGQNDYPAMAEKLLTLGDYGSAATIGNIGYQQGSLKQLETNPESVGYQRPATPAQSAPVRPGRQSSAQPYDERPARPNNQDGFNQPGSAPARVAQGGTTVSDAPEPGVVLPPNVKAEIDRRGNDGDFETRKRNLGKLMASPFPGVKEYAGKLLDSLLKERESTPAEKELRSGTTQAVTDINVGGKNRELTPEEKNVNPGRGNAAQRQSDIKLDEANRTLTPEQKNVRARPGESAAEAAQRVKTAGAIETKAGEGSVTNFEKDYRGLQVASQSAYNGIAKAKLGSALTQAPGFYSGPLQPTTQMYQQFKATFGANPSSATPQEAFQKVVTDMLTEQIKALGQSGVGRVLMVEVQNMQKSIASLGITPATNRVLLDTVQRVYGQSQQLAGLARAVASDKNIPPQDKQTALDQAADNFYRTNPIFSQAEVADPRMIGAPIVPSAIAPNGVVDAAHMPAFQAWAKDQNLPSGYPVKVGDKIKMVP